jgi:hypothetical protein
MEMENTATTEGDIIIMGIDKFLVDDEKVELPKKIIKVKKKMLLKAYF